MKRLWNWLFGGSAKRAEQLRKWTAVSHDIADFDLDGSKQSYIDTKAVIVPLSHRLKDILSPTSTVRIDWDIFIVLEQHYYRMQVRADAVNYLTDQIEGCNEESTIFNSTLSLFKDHLIELLDMVDVIGGYMDCIMQVADGQRALNDIITRNQISVA